MTFDRPEHKQVLIEMFDRASFAGQHAELAAEIRRTLHAGNVEQQQKPLKVVKTEEKSG